MLSCARSTFESLPSDRCPLCEGKVAADFTCGNPLCNRAVASRGWRHIWAISMRTGALRDAISAYKYDDKWGWGHIFGRVLVGYLRVLRDVGVSYDLIIPMPTYVGQGGRSSDHTARVVERAQIEDDSWPFRLDVMAKEAATPRLVDQPSFSARAEVAETQIASALRVLDKGAVAGKEVLVFDDVFTGGADPARGRQEAPRSRRHRS